ncbi:MAG TPA: prolyl oligopeptidase family serine peptidase [Candidatus Nanoarchaeia archaeon]|nr:prolyl oligopeptidase family serine peptidase [Candidatus Nanoarchaeia archaeon]
MHTLRTRIKKDIVCEFVAPKKRSNKVVIVCGGMPGYPLSKEILFWLSRRGYWAFLPRYRGTWESGGKFLRVSPHQDVLDIIEVLPKGFKDLWSGKILKIKNPKVYLIGSSFGGSAAILASQSSKVKKTVAFSPVVDWREEVHSETEPMPWLEKFTRAAFGEGYRFDHSDWKKLEQGKIYNPASAIKKLDAKKIFIIHANDDKVVYTPSVKKFVNDLGCQFLYLKKGGHLSARNAMKPQFWRKIKKFFQ